MIHMMTTTAQAKLTAKIDSQTTAQLLSHHRYLTNMPTREYEHHILMVQIADTIVERLDLQDAIDAFLDEDEEWDGDYNELMMIAIVRTGQDAEVAR